MNPDSNGLEGWDRGSSGMTCSVIGWFVAGDCGVNIPLGDPTVLASGTENLLV